MTRAWFRPFLGACAVLVLLIAWAWLPSTEPPPPRAPRAVHPAAAAPAADEEATDADQLAETVLARPLFTIGRRPVKIAESGGHAISSGMPRLSGIMITPAGRRAIFMPDGGKPQVVAVGASVDQHMVRAIDADGVLLEGMAQKLRPTLDRQRAGALTPNIVPPFQPTQFQPQQFQPQTFNAQNFQPGQGPPPVQLPGVPSSDEDGQTPNGQPPAGVPGPPFRPVVPRGRE